MIRLLSLLRRLSAPAAALLLVALAVAPLGAQTVTVARPVGAGGHDLLTADEMTGAGLAARQDVVFLPVSLAGRARSDRLLPDLPVLRGEGAAAPHVRLPGAGSLYRVGLSDGSTAWLREDGAGPPQVLITAPGAGLLEWIAVDDGGQRALVATTPAAGGDVLLLDLAGTAPPMDVTAALPPLAIEGISLRMGDGQLWFVAEDELYRADSAGFGVQPVPLQVAPGDVLVPELAASNDGNSVAVLSQDTLGDRHVHVVGSVGPSTRVTDTAAPIDAPGLDGPVGPRLALAPDGACVAWRRAVPTAELFVRRLDIPSPPVQVTADAQYADTFDGVGIIGFVGITQLLFAVGETTIDPTVSLDAADLFMLDTATTGDPVNLTQTSGLTAPPYDLPGELEIREVLLDPTGQRVLLRVDPAGGDEALLAVPFATPGVVETLVPTSEATVEIEPASQHLLVLVPDTGTGIGELLLVPPGGPPQSLIDVPLLVGVDRFAHDRSGGWAAFVASAGPAFELPVLVELASGALLPVWNKLFAVAPGQVFTASGRLATGIGVPGGPYLFAAFDAPLSGSVLKVGVGDGFPLAP